MRPVGWERRLEAYIEQSRDAPFVRGENCCALWVVGAVDAVLETSYAGEICGKFSTLGEGAAFMAERGWSDLGDAVEGLMGLQRAKGPLYARRGDVILVPASEQIDSPGGTLFVCMGRLWVGRQDGEKGLLRGPMRQLLPLGVRGYHVG